MRLLGKGAEAYIYLDNGNVIKERSSKAYRIDKLDVRLRKTRTKKECTAYKKCNLLGIPVPKLIRCDKYKLIIEYIDGVPLSKKISPALIKRAGEILASLHSNDICHGDYAPTNLIVKNNELYVIDFGLVEFSTYFEKKSADLMVMWNYLKNGELFDLFLEGYKSYVDSNKVIERFNLNLSRGRYKQR